MIPSNHRSQSKLENCNVNEYMAELPIFRKAVGNKVAIKVRLTFIL